jgi:hypothetical protein
VRRIAIAVVVTIVGLWLVLSFKSSPLHRGTALDAAANAVSTTTAAPPDTTSQPPAGPPPDSGNGSSTVPPTTAAPAPSATLSPTPPRTVNGTVVPNQYGDVQVAVVLSGRQIVDVKTLKLPFDRPRSAFISDQAAPLLRAEVLQLQSANIDVISEATYTSESYIRSLQAALAAAGL